MRRLYIGSSIWVDSSQYTQTTYSDFLEAKAAGQLAEVEFPDEASANSFTPPHWFGEDVTFSSQYHNSNLSKK